MKNKIALIVFCGIILNACIVVSDSLAVAYSPHTYDGCVAGIPHTYGNPSNNDAITSACSRAYYDGYSPAGAMWINGSGDGVDDVRESVTVVDYADDDTTTATVYLQGALVYAAGTSSFYNDEDISTYHLSLCESSCSSDGKNHVDYITNPAKNSTVSPLNRGHMPSSAWNWVNHWSQNKLALRVNLKKFKNKATKGTETTEGNLKCTPYVDNIHIVRYISIDGGASGSGVEADDTSTIKIKYCNTVVSKYTGSTKIYDGSTEKSNNYTISNIAANSKNIRFVHTITRDSNGPTGNDAEPYYVNSSASSKAKGSSSNVQSANFARGESKTVHDATITTSLAPGETKTIYQTLHFAEKSSDGSPNVVPGGTCTLYSTNHNGRYCVKLSRAAATFTGSVGAKVIADGGSTYVNPTSGGTPITTNTGNYSIRFTNSIKRGSDSAGGTASTDWSSVMKTGSATGTNIANTSKSGTTNALSTGESQTVIAASDNYVKTGTIGYTNATICNVLTFNATVKKNDNTPDSASECVKVYRTASTYTGTTKIYDGSTEKANNSTINNIAANSRTITFKHNLKRNNNGTDVTDNEKYYVNSWGTGHNLGGESDVKNSNFTKNQSKEIHSKDISVSVAPGGEVTVWQTQHYESDSSKSSPDAVPSGACTLMGRSIGGRYCIKLKRAKASFSGAVEAKIIANGGTTYVTPSTSSTGTEVTTSDGSFTIRFKNTITRGSDSAGGTVASHWSTVQKTGSVTGTNVSNSRKPASGTNATSALSVGGSEVVVKESDNYTYTSNLRYGESRTICNVLSYESVIDATNGNTTTTANACVKVYRQKAKCAINNSYRYGIHDGRNIGRIGVVNYTIAGSDAFQFTNYTPSTFTASNSYTNTVSVWARPGDSIRFRYEACAGASYAVFNTSTLNNNTYKTTYTASGKSSISGRTGYLFGASIPTVSTASPLKYSDSRTWNSYTATSGFLYNNSINGNAEFTGQSPSNTGVSTYAENTYNQKTYKCVELTDGPAYPSTGQHYQIAGRSNSTGCNSTTKTTNAGNDVGSTITQSYVWNDLNIVSGSVSGTTRSFTGKANVHIPYNYILKPYARRSSVSTNQNVVYGGSNFTVNTGIFVQPRTNTSISTSSSSNKYATITKPTKVKIERYFTTFDASGNISSTETDLTTIATYDNKTFNNNGNYKGITTESSAAYPSGGVSVYVPDNREIGSLVCLKYSVWPRDSHNNLSATSGAGNKSVALTSAAQVSGGTAASWAVARACYTVAKRPTVSFEGGNALAAGSTGFKTARYTRMLTSGSTKYLFGSWSEYALIGKNDAGNTKHGTASGATFGYQVGTTDVSINMARARNDATKVATDTNANNVCVFSSQGFSNNASCAEYVSSLGAQISSSANAARNFANNLRNHYTVEEPNRTVITSSLTGCTSITSPGNAKCVNINGNKYAHIKSGNGLLATTATGDTLYNRIDGSAFLTSTPAAPKQTTIYRVDGDLVIGGNILTASGDPSYNKTDSIRQNLIFANRVLIMPTVTKIDAVIVADEVDTCAYLSTAKLNSGTRTTTTSLTSNLCSNQLIFEAPVITKIIKLNRTYGATSGTGAIRRAEIFNYNMANYLWAYKQASKYSQANTTLIRELSPRY